jgi:hypothetical protein
MTELIIVSFICLAIVAHEWARDTAKESIELMVPHDIQKWGQHAANMSQKSQIAVFDGSTFDIMKADNQHAARGQILMVFHPNPLFMQKPSQEIKAGAVLRPRE